MPNGTTVWWLLFLLPRERKLSRDILVFLLNRVSRNTCDVMAPTSVIILWLRNSQLISFSRMHRLFVSLFMHLLNSLYRHKPNKVSLSVRLLLLLQNNETVFLEMEKRNFSCLFRQYNLIKWYNSIFHIKGANWGLTSEESLHSSKVSESVLRISSY